MTTPSTDCFDIEAKGLHLYYQQSMYDFDIAPPPPPPLVAHSLAHRLESPYEARGSPKLPASARATSERISVKRLSASQAVAGAACKKNGNEAMLKSVGTVFVVKDMVQMMKAVGDTSLNYWG